MKNRMLVVGALLLTGIAAWLGAQALAPVKPPAELMPAGALFYVEARNFAKLVSDWDGSPEKKAWLESVNYQSFARSHLLTRLSEARKSFTDAAGLPEDAPLLAGIAGGESAVAFYHIGKLEFLYITQIPSARFADSALGKVKQKFEPRKAGGRDYFLQSKGENSIAFALADDRLILATREDLMASSLKLLAGDKFGTLREERWYSEALSKAPAGAAPDVRFLADLDRTTKTHQFRSYWVHRNGDDVRQFASEVADLKFGPTDIREDRVFLRRDAQESMAAAEPAVADLIRYATADAGFYQAMAKPSADDVAELLTQKLFGHSKAPERQHRNKLAPDGPGGPSILGEDDYETRIDAPQIAESSVDAFAPLSALASNTDALLQTGVSRTAGVLPGIDAAVVLHGVKPWIAAEVKSALGQVAGAVWSVAPGSLEWTDRNTYVELNSVTPLRFAIEGNALVMSASPEWMSRMMAARRTAPAQGTGASYAASFHHARELPGFARMMHLIDFPSIPQGQQGDAREPLFFSENIASLAGAMSRLDSVSVTTHDTGAMVNESIVYRKK